MTQHLCLTCGGALTNENGAWSCKYCGNVYEDDSVKKEEELLRSLLDEYKTEQVANLRRSLYDAINAKYIDSEEICNICVRIKELIPDDFMASSLRVWLNQDFFDKAFNEKEKAMIAVTDIPPEKNPSFKTSRADTTQDRLFLLSMKEAVKYFSDSAAALRCSATEYANYSGAFKGSNGSCCWVLRTPARNHKDMAQIYAVSSEGWFYQVRVRERNHYCVRPAMWINITD